MAADPIYKNIRHRISPPSCRRWLKEPPPPPHRRRLKASGKDKMEKFVFCSRTETDCKAYRGGLCIALNNSKFKHGKPCPFYKSKFDDDKERTKK